MKVLAPYGEKVRKALTTYIPQISLVQWSLPSAAFLLAGVSPSLSGSQARRANQILHDRQPSSPDSFSFSGVGMPLSLSQPLSS
jgi:hypothetical protein